VADQAHPTRLGRYEIVAELGKGAMGVVYEGKDPNIGRRVAIKTARRDVMEASGMADEMMARFLREAQAAGKLNHPNIITIYDAGEEEGVAYIAMEFLEGGDLRGMLSQRQRMGMDEIVEIGATLAEALAVAHDHGIVHRDIKPANIMTPIKGPVKLADFGIAHVTDSNLTQEGALIGTPHYMSPEQFMGQKVDGRSDLFSLGNILYEMLTGEKPFTGEALSTVMHHVIKTDPVPPQELNFNVSDPVAKVIMKVLSKRPADRYPNGRALAAALRESLKENPDPAILEGRSSEVDATVMTIPGEEATMVGAASAMGQEDTPTLNVTATSEATTPGGPPPGASAQGEAGLTKAGGPPPGVTFLDAKLRLGLLVGAPVLVLLIAAVLIFPRLGGSAPGAMMTLRFDVYTTSDFETYLEWEDRGAETDARELFIRLSREGRINPAQNAKVTVEDISHGEVLGSARTDNTGMAAIEVPEDVERVVIRANLDGHMEEEYESLKTETGRWEQHRIVLAPDTD